MVLVRARRIKYLIMKISFKINRKGCQLLGLPLMEGKFNYTNLLKEQPPKMNLTCKQALTYLQITHTKPFPLSITITTILTLTLNHQITSLSTRQWLWSNLKSGALILKERFSMLSTLLSRAILQRWKKEQKVRRRGIARLRSFSISLVKHTHWSILVVILLPRVLQGRRSLEYLNLTN